MFQDCRGRGKSEGKYVRYLSDGLDGFDCCAWILAQSWSNGRIGTMGLSYAAHTQAALASAGAPGITAMFMDSGGFANAYQGGIRQGGAFELKQVTWAFNEALEAPEVRRDPAKLTVFKAIDLKDWFARLPWKRGHSPLSAVPEYEDYVFDQWEHGIFDDFWRQRGIYAAGYYDQLAVCGQCAYFLDDPYPRTVTDNFRALKRRKRGPYRMIRTSDPRTRRADLCRRRGIWRRGGIRGKRRAGLRGIEAALVRPLPQGQRKRRRTGAGRQNFHHGRRHRAPRRTRPINHGGTWRTERTWPIPRTRPTRSAIYSRTACCPSARPQRALYRENTATIRRLRYQPSAALLTSGQPIMVGGAFDQREGPRFFGCAPCMDHWRGALTCWFLRRGRWRRMSR